MKSKLLILSLLFCFNIYGQSVPNTSTFTLQDVVAVTGGTSLTSAFANATGTFDPAYVGSKNSLYNFRNYQQCPIVGDSAFGGKIAYIFVSGEPGYISGECHGIVATSSDQSIGVRWHSSDSGITGATGTAIGTGNTNTAAILALYGTETNAAKVCSDLVIGIYSDWFLPSTNELNKLYINRALIGGFKTSPPDYIYWTSTEFDNANAMVWRFDGFGGHTLKSSVCRVRAIRYF